MPVDICSRVQAVRGFVSVVLIHLLIPLFPAASAQVVFRHAPERLPAGEQANLFVEVTGSEQTDGFLLALPASWVLDDIRIVDDAGRPTKFSTEPLVEYANRWLILAESPVRSSSTLVLTVTPVSPSAASIATVTPVRRGTSDQQDQAPRVLESLRSRANLPVVSNVKATIGRSADLSALSEEPDRAAEKDGRILRINPDKVPGPWNTFSVEAWVRTTALEQIVLSTWTGHDGDPYPFELVIDGSGHLVSYQGTEDHHVSMRSDAPVADGSWHHVALVHDSPDGWTRLVVDGVRTDSLMHRRTMAFRQPGVIGLGTRVDSDDAETATSAIAYTGKLDQLRIWSTARSDAQIRASRSAPHIADIDGAFEVSFDRAPEDGAADYELNIPTTDDSPFVQRGITDLSVRSGPGGVTIVWSTPVDDAVAYEVERSSDGLRYTLVGRQEAGLPAGATYSVVDPAPGEGVMYYRIRAVLSEGGERLSDAVKVGMGESGKEQTVILTGNFPNPFNPTTRISYTVRETQQVQVSVWDLSGQQVTVLVDRTVSPGYHEVSFDAEGLPSGTYFVRLSTPEGTQTHQMVLMK